jgi:hypothetical protein
MVYCHDYVTATETASKLIFERKTLTHKKNIKQKRAVFNKYEPLGTLEI